MSRLIRHAIAAACLASTPAAANEYTRFEPLPYAAIPANGDTLGCTGVALMNLPEAWRPGEPAVLLLTDAALHDPRRDALVAMLLDQHVAVVEAGAGTHLLCDGDQAATTRLAPPGEPLAILFGLLEAARRVGAGPVVAIGYGPGASVALQATREEAAALYIAPGTARFAGAAALGDGPPNFVLGPVAGGGEVGARATGLCNALAAVAGGLAAADRAEPAIAADACRSQFARDPSLARR